MLCRWFLTVCSLMNIFSAISLFLKPWATSATISRSRWLSGERSRSRVGGAGGRDCTAGSFVVGDELPDDGRGGVGIQPDFSGVDFADALDEQFGRGLLQNDSGGAQLHRLDEFVLVVGSGENNHAGFVFGDLEALQRGQTVQAGHFQIQQQDIGFMLLQNIEHLATVLGLSYDFEILFQGEQPAESIAEDRMIVRYYDPDLGLGRRSHSGRSIRASTVLSHTLSVRNCRVLLVPSQTSLAGLPGFEF